MNKIKVLASSDTKLKSKILPLPNISLTAPNAVKAIVNPIPIPKASTIDENKLFFDAKASARPNIKQFTTINGMNIPNCSYKKGINASKTISTIVTNDAITIMNAGILTLLGICFFIKDTTMFDMRSTKRVAIPIPKPLKADEVTPKAGHIPNNMTKTGLSLIIPFKKFSFWVTVPAMITNF